MAIKLLLRTINYKVNLMLLLFAGPWTTYSKAGHNEKLVQVSSDSFGLITSQMGAQGEF